MVTVVNIDTGAVASETILPGVLTPEWIPSETEGIPRWALPLSPVVDRLAASVGGAVITSHENTNGLAWSLAVPGEWSPDLPAETRLALEAGAIARAQARTRHRHFFTSTAAAGPTGPDARLAYLAELADLLHLDLCCTRSPLRTLHRNRPARGRPLPAVRADRSPPLRLSPGAG
ncbi:hypothetical protein [Glycomyces terrestris]|uniref:Uncharacterized protein n=1 Tax=Glycomyces terrestris TaxID=2493553 RepID=A0A426V3G9_9ACTN|nr:hypothetical protein [Glycomyces terrestris]RRS01381.1 hypothetical protein EIW28_00980 [Glycomyces terrestris]